jgi:hypothetical protein
VNALDLSGGDKTGMWMLNYPFPYDSPAVQQGFARYLSALDSAVNAPDSQLKARFRAFCAVRGEFLRSLKDGDRKYMSFQLWQEGVARYTELSVAEWAAAHYKASAALKALADFKPFALFAGKLKQSVGGENLGKVSLAEHQRVAFYPAGCAEAYLLDRVKPGWHAAYFEHLLTLDPEFER